MKKIILFGIVLAVIIAVAAFFFVIRKPSIQSSTPSAAKQKKSATEAVKETLTNLIAKGQSIKCTYDYTQNKQSETSGTVYISGGKMRGQFQTNTAGKKSTIHIISDGQYSYVWGTDMKEGMKMKIQKNKTASSNEDESKKYFDPDKELDYNCSLWNADKSIFVPPTDTVFKDFSAMMEDTQKQTDKLKSSQCSACANLSGESQEQCKKTLNCS